MNILSNLAKHKVGSHWFHLRDHAHPFLLAEAWMGSRSDCQHALIDGQRQQSTALMAVEDPPPQVLQCTPGILIELAAGPLAFPLTIKTLFCGVKERIHTAGLHLPLAPSTNKRGSPLPRT